MQEITAHNHSIIFKLDIEAQVNVLPVATFWNLHIPPALMPTSLKICTYSGDALSVVGDSMHKCAINYLSYNLKFIAENQNVQPVLSAAACYLLILFKE